MFCKNCGRQLDEGENVCPVCGTVNGGETATAPSVEYGYNAVNAANEQMKSEMAGQALKWGILSLAFSASGCLSLLGGPRKAKRYRKIKLRWQNEALQTRIKTFEGWSAQVIQHEVDHCRGVLI